MSLGLVDARWNRQEIRTEMSKLQRRGGNPPVRCSLMAGWGGLQPGAQDPILPHNCSAPPPRGAQAVYGLLAFETVYAVLVSFRDVGRSEEHTSELQSP